MIDAVRLGLVSDPVDHPADSLLRSQELAQQITTDVAQRVDQTVDLCLHGGSFCVVHISSCDDLTGQHLVAVHGCRRELVDSHEIIEHTTWRSSICRFPVHTSCTKASS